MTLKPVFGTCASRLGAAMAVALCCSACGRKGDEAAANAAWRTLAGGMTNIDRLARLDIPNARLFSSYDRRGGNEDYNNPLRPGATGWFVMADVPGPGYVSRFWFTGATAEGAYRVRFTFDNERTPRLDTSLVGLCGEREQYCWLSYLPIPYAKRLVIEGQDISTPPGGPRLFYQVDTCALPKGSVVSSFPDALDPASQALAARLNAMWKQALPPGAIAVPTGRSRCTVQPGESAACATLAGPAVLTALDLTPAWSELPSALARESLLRDLVLHITWDNAAAPSVAVPLGDFFGSMWHRTRFRALFIGMQQDSFYSRLPMPFRSAAKIAVENQGKLPVSTDVAWTTKPLPAWSDAWGYFHAGWRRTGPEDVGHPHPILKTAGKGKYVGCLLSVTSLDGSYWILEGDESIRVDDEGSPQWKGTGLEDYFNGGWYYQQPMARPLHGLLLRAPYRTIQYRFHLNDPVCFAKDVDMEFERGPDQASRGWMESVAYYYLTAPQPAASVLGSAESRTPPHDPLAGETLMTELIGDERLGDYRGAMERVEAALEAHPASPFADVLRVRMLAYRARLEGMGAARTDLEKATADTNAVAAAQAKQLLWYEAGADRALLGAYCNARTRIYIDGTAVLEVDHPEQFAVRGVVLQPGKHVLAAEAQWTRPLPWVQICLRTHAGDIVTAPDWKWSRTAGPDWLQPSFDDSAWQAYAKSGMKGPPEEPYVRLDPNVFVGMQADAMGMRAQDWDTRRDHVYFRKAFVLPAQRDGAGK